MSEDKKTLIELINQKALKPEEIDAIIEVGTKELNNLNEKMYEQASQMEDRGFGPFARCLHYLAVCEGDRKEAEDLLSKLMMKKSKR